MTQTKCKLCQTDFIFRKNQRELFCSFECSINFRSVKDRICEFCNKEFRPSLRSHLRIQKFCSVACSCKSHVKQTDELIASNRYSCPTHGVMTLDNFYKQGSRNNKYGNGARYSCRICNKERSQRYLHANREALSKKKKEAYIEKRKDPEYKERFKFLQNKWRQDNKEKDLAQRARYREKYREITNQKSKIRTETLKPYYVKSCMVTKLKMSEIPKELIELKTIHMKLKRKIKELKHGNK